MAGWGGGVSRTQAAQEDDRTAHSCAEEEEKGRRWEGFAYLTDELLLGGYVEAPVETASLQGFQQQVLPPQQAGLLALPRVAGGRPGGRAVAQGEAGGRGPCRRGVGGHGGLVDGDLGRAGGLHRGHGFPAHQGLHPDGGGGGGVGGGGGRSEEHVGDCITCHVSLSQAHGVSSTSHESQPPASESGW